MVLPLEERLKGLQVYHSQLVKALLIDAIVPESGSYLKYDLAERIAGYLDRKGVFLREQDGVTSTKGRIYQAVNKEPLKRAEYGILNSKGIPEEIFKRLTEWEALYFLAGVWIKKSTKNPGLKYSKGLLKRQPVDLMIAETIYAGINSLNTVHTRQAIAGKYKTRAELPYSEEIKQRYLALRSSYVAERKRLFQEFERQVKLEDDALRVVTILEEMFNGISDDSIRNRIQGLLDVNTDRFVEASTRVGIMIEGMQGDDYARAVKIAGEQLDIKKYLGVTMQDKDLPWLIRLGLSEKEIGILGLNVQLEYPCLDFRT